MKPILVLLNLAFFVTQATAAYVPGTSVDINPPPGFALSERFPGYMNKKNGSSIMILEFDGPYVEVTDAFLDVKNMRAKGMALLGISSVNVDGKIAMLMHAIQSVYGKRFKKWILAVDRSGSTTLIVATYPSTESKQLEQLLKKAVLTAKFGKQTDPIDALSFNIEPEAPFEIAKVMGQTLILSPNGQFPTKDRNIPAMIVGLSLSENWSVQHKKKFAESRVLQTVTVKNITIQQSTPVTVGTLTGYSTLATGTAEKTAVPLTIYQVMLFDLSGYCLMLGLTPSALREEYLPIFRKMAKSFRMKTPVNKAINGVAVERKVDSDIQLSQTIIGKWKSELIEGDIEIKGINTFTADGKILSNAKMLVSGQKIDIEVEGTWIIKNGVVILTVTKTNIPEIIPLDSIKRNTIITLNNNVYQYMDEDGKILTEYRMVSRTN